MKSGDRLTVYSGSLAVSDTVLSTSGGLGFSSAGATADCFRFMFILVIHGQMGSFFVSHEGRQPGMTAMEGAKWLCSFDIASIRNSVVA
jgi:hypothetical protein